MRSTMYLGLGAWALTWSAVLINGAPGRGDLPAGVFAATVSGAVDARPRGAAAFGLVTQPDAPATYSITLTSPGLGGAVVLTGHPGEWPIAGRSYRIGESGEPGTFQGLYVAGAAERPAGVFHASAGTLEVLAAGPTHIQARFRLDARGFLASAPEEEDRRVAVTGWFAADTHGLAVSAADDHAVRLP